MLRQALCRVQACRSVVHQLKCNFGASSAMAQTAPTDPIQKLFLDKIREYSQKSKTTDGGLVDASPDVLKTLNDELEKIKRVYGAASPDFLKFPTFNFADAKLEAVGVDATAKEDSALVEEEVVEEQEEDPHRTYWEP